MTAEAAAANVAAIKQMIAQNDSWRDLQTGAKAKRAMLALLPSPPADRRRPPPPRRRAPRLR